MKKRLYFMSNQNGFFLPYVLFITALIFIILTASVNIYSNDTRITHSLMEQIKIETLLQMGRTKFKKEITELKPSGEQVHYTFPDGIVKIKYLKLSNVEYQLQFTILTNKNNSYTLPNRLYVYK